MAILARLAFGTPVHLTTCATRASSTLHGDDLEYARELGLGLKLIGTAERRDGGLSVRVHPAFLYGGHPLVGAGPFNAVTVESEAITKITMSGRGAGGRQTASAVLGDVVSVMTGGARPPAPPLALRLIEDVESAFYMHLDVADRPGVLAAVMQALGDHGVSIKSVVQRGLGENARLVMVTHPVLESSLRAAIERVGGFDFVRSAARIIRVIERSSYERGEHQGPKGGGPPPTGPRAADRALPRASPFAPGDPLISLQEGSTPLLRAPVLSEMVGATVR